MFSLRSRAVRFRQLWMETRLELIYNVVIPTRSAPNTATINASGHSAPTLDNRHVPVDLGHRVIERIGVGEASELERKSLVMPRSSSQSAAHRALR